MKLGVAWSLSHLLAGLGKGLVCKSVRHFAKPFHAKQAKHFADADADAAWAWLRD